MNDSRGKAPYVKKSSISSAGLLQMSWTAQIPSKLKYRPDLCDWEYLQKSPTGLACLLSFYFNREFVGCKTRFLLIQIVR